MVKVCPMYDTKLHLMMKLHSWSLENVYYLFVTIIFSSTLIRNSSTCSDPIYESNRVKSMSHLLKIIITFIDYLKSYSNVLIVYTR